MGCSARAIWNIWCRGRYDQRQGRLSSRTYTGNCRQCNFWEQDVADNYFVSAIAGYTTESALSLGAA
ncbi:hypothetical protein GGER_05430 [Serratia rubidaea]